MTTINDSSMKQLLCLCATLIMYITGIAQNQIHQSDVRFVAVPNHADWNYRTGENARIDLQVFAYGVPYDGAEVSYEIGPELLPADTKGTLTLKNGRATLQLGTMKKPGFRDCRFTVKHGGKQYKHHVKVAFSPEKIVPTVKMPTDFEEFWTRTKEEAAKCPMTVQRTFVPEYSNEKVDCYLIKLQCYRKGQYVYGYLTQPKAKGTYPVVFNPPGAGIKPMDPLKTMYFAENGIICFNMEIHGIRPNLDAATYKEVSAAFGNGNNSYLVNGLDNRENYYMRKVYMACVRALDYLTSLPEWDGKNLIAQGGSQGGALAIITAGLDKRITQCVANHPALSDMEGYLHDQCGGYPHLIRSNEQLTKEKVKVLAYYDVVNFAKQLTVPTYLTWGYNDNTCPATTSYAVYNSITAPKEALITPINEHWVSTETRHNQMYWIKDHLK